MSSPGVTSCLLLLLLLAAVHSASVGGQSEQAAGTLSAAAPDPSVSGTTANVTEENGDDIIRIGIPKLSEKAEKSKLNKSEMDDDEDEGKEEEAAENEEKEEEEEEEEEQEDEGDYEEAYEGEDDDDEDEYEDELKTIAESHEAMSKDEATSRNASSAGNERPEGKLSNARNFDSHERSSKDTFDEDTTSNEAFTDDVIEKAQTKVVELLKQYKHKLGKNTRTKVKRMPTVKKELSTQKEILLAANETQVPKSLLPSEDPHNRLSGKTDSVQRRSLERSEAQEEVTLAKSLLKFLVKLAEDPNGWQCIHKMLANVENDLQASRNIQDPVKRGYDTTATLSSTMPPTSKAPRKGPKKPRKKKKRPRHRQTPSTTVGFTATTTPETSPLLTTTEAQSTTPHWRLVAERLFSPPWQSKVHEKSKNVAKVRYGIASKPRAPVWELQDKIDQQDKPKNILRTMSNERAPLLLDFPREVSGQSRSMRFGKVNTYQPLRLQDSREFTSMSYDRPADPDRSADYYLPEATYSRLRYGPSHEFSHRRSENDYQDDLSLRTDNFAYNQEYRPTSREFASSKSWSNPSYKSRPWDEQAVLVSSEKWPWRQHGDFKYWPERGKYSDRNYWMTMRSGEEGDDRINPPTEMDEEWQQQRLPLWREASKSGGWSMGKNLKPPQHLWPQADMSVKPYDQSRTAWEKSKNHSELDKKENVDNKVVLPKITMKTWNSLTSDPATWPYKLPSAKPWPKDENGKSYNPNADLVKKLGLDKENDDARSKEKDERTGRLVFEKQIDSDHPSSKEASKKKEILLGEPKYKPMDNRSNYSDYRPRNSESQESTKERPNWAYQDVKQSKDWNKPLLASNVLRNGEANSWSHKFETPTGNQAKTVSPNDDNFSFSHFWPANAGGEQNWTDKKGESSAESWKDNDKEISTPKVKPHNGLNFWKEKSNNSWLPKAKTDLWRSRMKSAPTSWTSKMGENNSWTTKVDNGWMLKPNKADSWTTNANIWEKSHSADSWPRSSGELTAWKDKNLVMHNAWSKSNSGDWSQKTKDNNSWVNSFNNMATWKSNEDNWSRKPEQSVWQQKMNDDWNIDYGKSSASTWPTRWKQFAYHKVTAMPISKPGTAADVSSKSKNAFVAVSAVSSANYNGGNDWRKGDVEEAIREDNFRLDEMERGGNQIRPERVERPIYAWKKDGSELNNGGRVKNNGTDALENQLESLKQDYWSFKENKIEVDEESTYGRTSTTTQTAMVTKLSTTSQSPKSPRTLPAPKDVEERPEIYQQSLMK